MHLAPEASALSPELRGHDQSIVPTAIRGFLSARPRRRSNDPDPPERVLGDAGVDIGEGFSEAEVFDPTCPSLIVISSPLWMKVPTAERTAAVPDSAASPSQARTSSTLNGRSSTR